MWVLGCARRLGLWLWLGLGLWWLLAAGLALLPVEDVGDGLLQVGVDGRLALGVDFGLLLERQCGHLLHLGLAVLELVAGLGQGTVSLIELSPGRVELAAQLPGGVETGFLRGPELLQLAAFVFGLVLGAVQHGERVACLELELVAFNGEVLYRFQLVAYGLVEVGYQVV